MSADLAKQRPIVVHVVVALCDNAHQGIVPVAKSLGNGQDPDTNLYWGALYGVRSHFPRKAGWKKLAAPPAQNPHILDRVVFYASLSRGGARVPVYVVAEAWDGAKIRDAMESYFDMAAGRSAETLTVQNGSETVSLQAGGAAHLIAYVGHDGLMDFDLAPPAPPARRAPARSAVALACFSKSYFLGHLRAAGAHPLLLTKGLMAPEAYTLDAAIRAWAGSDDGSAVVKAASRAYDSYQHCGQRAARRLFWGSSIADPPN